jgi:hypothetical protein
MQPSHTPMDALVADQDSLPCACVLRIVLIRRIGDSERSCTPDILLVLSICGELDNRNNVGEDLVERSELKSEIQKLEVGGHRVGGSGCWNVGERLRQEED